MGGGPRSTTVRTGPVGCRRKPGGGLLAQFPAPPHCRWGVVHEGRGADDKGDAPARRLVAPVTRFCRLAASTIRAPLVSLITLGEQTDSVMDTERVAEVGNGMTELTGTGEDLVIRGRVRDALGVALPRAVVTLSGVEGGKNLDKTRSGADGSFEVRAPFEGDFVLSAFSPQLGTQSVEIRLDGVRPVEVEFMIDVPGVVPE
ncbi:carboxypeptidase regulatory-like domain-containing protein [Streptomyces sedi]|uniref:Carboxypeptidase regulatory-like domain-containing protein n=2 Tax=Streptomyces sedi TaxID=555059 RepID=A0A5C4UZE5_9ACTN|nr:carboxypeptidase regulatory-like domain-containing protein [Streptomyces sedi]